MRPLDDVTWLELHGISHHSLEGVDAKIPRGRLTVVTGVYAFGHISGGHFNPAVTLGVYTAGRISFSDVIPYWVAQVAGGIVAGAVLYSIASGSAGFDPAASGFAANGYAEHSPQGYSMEAALICEVVMTFMFLLVILGST